MMNNPLWDVGEVVKEHKEEKKMENKKKFSETTKDLLIDQIRNSHFEFLDDLVEGEGVMPDMVKFVSNIPFCGKKGRDGDVCVDITFNVY